MSEENKQPVTEKKDAPSATNPMKNIRIEKVSLNIGAGKNEDMLKKGLVLLQKITPQKPVKTFAKKRIPTWGLRPGLAIGCKVTIRKDAAKLLKRLLVAKSNILTAKNFDNKGNFSFGIPEYIEIEGLEYDPDLKIMGLEVAVNLSRPGERLKTRKLKSKKIGKKHLVTKEEAMTFMKGFGVEIE